MESAKERADNWVEEEKWRDFEKSKGELDEKVDLDRGKKPTKSTEEKIDDNINSANRKIIKVWKGEK